MASANMPSHDRTVKRYLFKILFGPPTYTQSETMIAAIDAFCHNAPRGSSWTFSADSPRNDGSLIMQYSCGEVMVERLNRYIITLFVNAPGSFTNYTVVPFDFDGTNDPVYNDDENVDSFAF